MNAMTRRGEGHLDRVVLPQRAVDRKARRIANLFTVNGFFCASERTAAVLGQHDLGSGGLYPLDLVRSGRVTPMERQVSALNFGATKTALAMEESRSLGGPYGN